MTGFIITSPEEDGLVGRVWEQLRARYYYSSQSCLSCGAVPSAPPTRAGDKWRVVHFIRCSVPLLQATEEIVVRKVVRYFTDRRLDIFDELPLAAAMITTEFEGMNIHYPVAHQ